MPELHLRVLASDVTLCALSPATVHRLARDWSRCLDGAGAGGRRVDVHADGLDRTDGLGAPLTARLTRVGVEDLVGSAVVLHASGLACPDGGTLALVGPSGAGKSTAAALLAREHFGYVTDECLAVTTSGRVLPYPKPLALALAAGIGAVQVSPDELGLARCPGELTLAGVVLLDRVSSEDAADGWNGSDEPLLAPVGLVDAVLALVPHTTSLTALERPLQRLCTMVTAAGGAARLRYQDILGCGDVLTAFLRRAPGVVEGWAPVDPGDSDDVTWALRDGRVRRRPVQDAVRVGDELLLLAEDRPVRLAGVGATVWACADRPLELPALAHRVVAAHGGHPEAESLVREAVAALVEARVLGCFPPVPADRLATTPPGSWS